LLEKSLTNNEKEVKIDEKSPNGDNFTCPSVISWSNEA
jgi:hypothetical protein